MIVYSTVCNYIKGNMNLLSTQSLENKDKLTEEDIISLFEAVRFPFMGQGNRKNILFNIRSTTRGFKERNGSPISTNGGFN